MSAAQKSPVYSLAVQAAIPEVEAPKRSQLSLLTRHFLERFLQHESVTASGETKARLIQTACAIGLPPIIVAMYLWSAYHRVDRKMPSYWDQVGHHFFFVMYALVATGIGMVYEWDLFFPDLLDIFVLSTLPVAQLRLFLARILAIGIFVAGFLFDANVIAPFALIAASDPPHMGRFLVAHLLAVLGGGIFSAALVLGVQAVLLGVLGEGFFRRIAPVLQAGAITMLLMLLFLLPALSSVLSGLLQPENHSALLFPPFWFMGIYQLVLEGSSALPIYTRLAQAGCIAIALSVTVACLFYPLAYWRRTNGLIAGQRASRAFRQHLSVLQQLLHATVLRLPLRRAVFHFTSQTLLRVQRYRIYLVMCGGVAFSLAVAMLVGFRMRGSHVYVTLSENGRYAPIPILVFWTVAALRMAFLAPGNERGSWIFRTILGKPPLDALMAAMQWVFLCAFFFAMVCMVPLDLIMPLTLREIAIEVIVFTGLCLLLTDIFFLNVRMLPFTQIEAGEKPNLAIAVMKYIAFFPAFVFLPVTLIPWAQENILNTFAVLVAIILLQLWLLQIHRNGVRQSLALADLEEETEILGLGLR